MTRNVIYKTLNILFQYFVQKAGLPPGTRRQRKDGIYVKQPNGNWLKEPKEKNDKEGKSEKIKELESQKKYSQIAINNAKEVLSKKPDDKIAQRVIAYHEQKIKSLDEQIKSGKREEDKKPGKKKMGKKEILDRFNVKEIDVKSRWNSTRIKAYYTDVYLKGKKPPFELEPEDKAVLAFRYGKLL